MYHQIFYDDPYDLDDPSVSRSLDGTGEFCKTAINNMQSEIDALNGSIRTAAAAVPFSKHKITITGATPAELVVNARDFLTKGTPKRPMRGVDALLIELCASAGSELIQQVPYGSAAIRITDQQVLTNSKTLRAIRAIIRLARRNQVRVLVWVATP